MKQCIKEAGLFQLYVFHDYFYIKKCYPNFDSYIIANILWVPQRNSATINTIDTNLQDHVVLEQDYKDFIKLVDIAYDKLYIKYLGKAAHNENITL